MFPVESKQFSLGLIYSDGFGVPYGVPKDYVRAHMWLSLAADRVPAGKGRDVTVAYREIIEEEMTPEQITEAQRLAKEWKPK